MSEQQRLEEVLEEGEDEGFHLIWEMDCVGVAFPPLLNQTMKDSGSLWIKNARL